MWDSRVGVHRMEGGWGLVMVDFYATTEDDRDGMGLDGNDRDGDGDGV